LGRIPVRQIFLTNQAGKLPTRVVQPFAEFYIVGLSMLDRDEGIVSCAAHFHREAMLHFQQRLSWACGTFLDMLITYFSIILICFLLQFFHRGLRIGLL
jgi:hypothetical protein